MAKLCGKIHYLFLFEKKRAFLDYQVDGISIPSDNALYAGALYSLCIMLQKLKSLKIKPKHLLKNLKFNTLCPDCIEACYANRKINFNLHSGLFGVFDNETKRFITPGPDHLRQLLVHP